MSRNLQPSRHPLRLKDYDYTRYGAYFVTVCTYRKLLLFGSVCDSVISLTPLGRLVHQTWGALPQMCTGVQLDRFLVMPNHLHGILLIGETSVEESPGSPGRPQGSAPTSLPAAVGRFKSLTVVRAIKEEVIAPGTNCSGRVWQRSYYDHVIRNDGSLDRIREYIVNNPAQWSLDRENPSLVPPSRNAAGREDWMV